MRVLRTHLAVLAGVLALLAAAGCSNEKTFFSLPVTASPNPVVAVDGPDGRRWDYRITIQNPIGIGIVVENYHHSVTGTDSGYAQPLLHENNWPLAGEWIAPGQSRSYEANRFAEGFFQKGTERRVYHARGDDGRYYSGEVVIVLQ